MSSLGLSKPTWGWCQLVPCLPNMRKVPGLILRTIEAKRDGLNPKQQPLEVKAGRTDDEGHLWLHSELEDSSGHTRASLKKLMPGRDAPVVSPTSCGYPLPTFLSGKADLKGIYDHRVSYT